VHQGVLTPVAVCTGGAFDRARRGPVECADLLNVQTSLGGACATASLTALARFRSAARMAVFERTGGYVLHIQPGGRTHRAHGNLAAIRYQDLLQHVLLRGWARA
jgi:hypothetical protein